MNKNCLKSLSLIVFTSLPVGSLVISAFHTKGTVCLIYVVILRSTGGGQSSSDRASLLVLTYPPVLAPWLQPVFAFHRGCQVDWKLTISGGNSVHCTDNFAHADLESTSCSQVNLAGAAMKAMPHAVVAPEPVS